MDESNTRLREARKKAGFKSARAAALRFRWVPSTYASHENGQTPVPKEDAREYARAFKVDRAWLLNVDDSRPPPKLKIVPSSNPHFVLGPQPDMEFNAA